MAGQQRLLDVQEKDMSARRAGRRLGSGIRESQSEPGGLGQLSGKVAFQGQGFKFDCNTAISNLSRAFTIEYFPFK